MKVVEEAFGEVLRYFSPESSFLDEASRLARYDEATVVIASYPETAAGYLATRFEGDDFAVKSAAYRLLVSLGKDVTRHLQNPPQGCGEAGRIWVATIFHYFGVDPAAYRFPELLVSPNGYIRHIAALATVFQGRAATVDRDLLMESLVEALSSNEHIEGSPYFVADSALSCIGLLTVVRFSDSQQQNVQFYNFNHFLFPPPVHPFPYTSERVAIMPDAARRALAERIRVWWLENGRSLDLSGCRNFLQY